MNRMTIFFLFLFFCSECICSETLTQLFDEYVILSRKSQLSQSDTREIQMLSKLKKQCQAEIQNLILKNRESMENIFELLEKYGNDLKGINEVIAPILSEELLNRNRISEYSGDDDISSSMASPRFLPSVWKEIPGLFGNPLPGMKGKKLAELFPDFSFMNEPLKLVYIGKTAENSKEVTIHGGIFPGKGLILDDPPVLFKKNNRYHLVYQGKNHDLLENNAVQTGYGFMEKSGEITVFSCSGMKMFFTDKGIREIINEQGGKIRYYYDMEGRLERRVDVNGKCTEYAWNCLFPEKPAKISNFIGRDFSFSYDPDGNLSDISAQSGVYSLEWDENEFLVCQISPDGACRYYAYDKSGFPVRIFHPDGTVTEREISAEKNLSVSEKLPSGEIRTAVYDSQGRLKEFSQAEKFRISYFYDSTGRLVLAEDTENRQWKYTYDRENRVLKYQNPENKIRSFTYDQRFILHNHFFSDGKKKHGFINRAVLEDSTVSEFYHDNSGNILRKNEDGRISEYFYDEKGNLVLRLDGSGSVWKFEYDSDNRLTNISDSSGDYLNLSWNGSDLERISAQKRELRFKRDGCGRVIEFIREPGQKMILDYDAGGNLSGLTDFMDRKIEFRRENGRITGVHSGEDGLKFGYDNTGMLVSLECGELKNEFVRNKDGVISEIKTAQGESWNFTWGKSGQLLSFLDPEQRGGWFGYDASDRIVSFSSGEEKTFFVKWASTDSVSEIKNGAALFRFRNSKNSLALNTPSGGTVEISFNSPDKSGQNEDMFFAETDEYGRIIRTKKGKRNIDFERDLSGNIRKITYPSGRKTVFTRDSSGKVIRTDRGAETVWEKGYDRNGFLVRRFFGSAREEYFEYDSSNRISAFSGGKGKYQITYGSDMNIKEISGENYSVEVQADPFNGGNITLKGNQEKIRFEYSRGLLKTVSFPVQRKTIDLSRDRSGKILKISSGQVFQSMKYDDSGRISQVENSDYSVDIEKDSSGRIMQAEYPGNLIWKNYYYPDGRPELSIVLQKGNEVFQIRYEYDRNGKLNGYTDYFSGISTGVFFFRNSEGDYTGWQYTGGSDVFKICRDSDGLSERISRINLADQIFKRNEAGFITDTSTEPLTPSAAVLNDAEGKRISDRMRKFSYDSLGRLTEVEMEQVKVLYSYDLWGNIFSRTELHGKKEIREDYLWLNRQCLMKNNDSGVRSYLTDEDGQVFAYTDGNKSYACMQFPSGIVNLSADQEGNIIDINRFDPAGMSEKPGDFPSFKNCFCDSATGLYYIDKRWYDPQYLCFLTPEETDAESQVLSGFPVGDLSFSDLSFLKEERNSAQTFTGLFFGNINWQKLLPDDVWLVLTLCHGSGMLDTVKKFMSFTGDGNYLNQPLDFFVEQLITDSTVQRTLDMFLMNHPENRCGYSTVADLEKYLSDEYSETLLYLIKKEQE